MGYKCNLPMVGDISNFERSFLVGRFQVTCLGNYLIILIMRRMQKVRAHR